MALNVTLTDPGVLDCPICCEPFTAPVFQCSNGHPVCSSCCSKLANRCASCSLPVGRIRCRPIEKVIESLEVPCRNSIYGCKETVGYRKKFNHRHYKTCIYAPCSCPHFECNFVGSSRQLYEHYSSSTHAASRIRFKFKKCFSISFATYDQIKVLLEETQGVMFVVNNKAEPNCHAIMVNCIAPSSSLAQYSYDLTAKKKGRYLHFSSETMNIPSRTETPSEGFLLVPEEFNDTLFSFTLELCIREATDV
ncbi:hypothetical protein Tsubulata_003982 [Turnera subulata]|uniref:RING-type E3 ubiquitin transferase n=1 Tax=Turnera subulata TaxID=218843 RepID=A0A9Q0GC74_9ROSI|nr:hypothetical protein Tsubulata_003982 [Turnera subulata]